MHNLVKGSIAAAAGVALLAGGVGTFAFWNSSASVSAPSVTAGTLQLTSNSDGVWKNAQGGTFIPATDRIVPGATLTYTQTLTVVATGNGLKANLSFTGLSGGNNLGSVVTVTPTATSGSTTVGNGGTLNFTSGTSTVTATVTVTFPFGSAVDNTSQNQVLDLSQGAFVLTQVA